MCDKGCAIIIKLDKMLLLVSSSGCIKSPVSQNTFVDEEFNPILFSLFKLACTKVQEELLQSPRRWH